MWFFSLCFLGSWHERAADGLAAFGVSLARDGFSFMLRGISGKNFEIEFVLFSDDKKKFVFNFQSWFDDVLSWIAFAGRRLDGTNVL